MKTGALMLLVTVATYYLASLIQTIFHRFFGHVPRIVKLYETHVKGHHAQYAREMLSDRWIPTEQHITGYYAIPFIPIVCAAYCLLPGIYFMAHLCGLAFAIWWHIYLHRQYHVRGAWWERFAWFREKRQLHFLHHQKPHKNFAIVEYSWDLLFGTFDDALGENSAKPLTRVAPLYSHQAHKRTPSPPRSGGEGRGEVVLRVQGKKTESCRSNVSQNKTIEQLSPTTIDL